MSRLTRALEQLPLRHRPRGPEAVLASARHAAERDRARRRAVIGGGLAAALVVAAGLGVWAASGDEPTQVETGPIDAPTTSEPLAPEPAPAPTEPTTTEADPSPTTTVPVEGPDDGTPVEIHVVPSGGSDDCSATVAVERRVDGPGVLEATLEALLAGPTAAEVDAGLTGFPTDRARLLDSVAIANGTARVDFDGALASTIPNASTSCGSTSLLAQLDRTVRQFPTVGRVIYSLDGDIDAFYAWLQRVAPEVAPTWDGTLEEDWTNGDVQAPGFDEQVGRDQPAWAFDAREAAMVLIGLPSLTEPVDVDIAHGAIDGGRTVVTITQSGFRDDSVNATQHRIVFEQDRDGGLVRFVEGTISTRCQPGRGHQDFQTTLCP